MNDTTMATPDGVAAATAADVITLPTPERYEDVELWAVTSFGKSEVITVRPEIGDSAKLQQSPLDGSFIGLMFEFHAGDGKNEITGRQFFNLGPGISYKFAYHKMPHYKNGSSPAEIEMKRRAKVKEDRIAERAALLAQGLDED